MGQARIMTTIEDAYRNLEDDAESTNWSGSMTNLMQCVGQQSNQRYYVERPDGRHLIPPGNTFLRVERIRRIGYHTPRRVGNR